MTQNERILALLADGKPHDHHSLYALGCVAHSRISELRARGYVIDQWREDDLYLYRLVSRPTLTEGDRGLPDAAPRTPSVSAPRQLTLDEAAA